jgi:hypothetical protein
MQLPVKKGGVLFYEKPVSRPSEEEPMIIEENSMIWYI